MNEQLILPECVIGDGVAFHDMWFMMTIIWSQGKSTNYICRNVTVVFVKCFNLTGGSLVIHVRALLCI